MEGQGAGLSGLPNEDTRAVGRPSARSVALQPANAGAGNGSAAHLVKLMLARHWGADVMRFDAFQFLPFASRPVGSSVVMGEPHLSQTPR